MINIIIIFGISLHQGGTVCLGHRKIMTDQLFDFQAGNKLCTVTFVVISYLAFILRAHVGYEMVDN